MATGLGQHRETLPSLEQPGIAIKLTFQLQSLPTSLHPLLLAQTYPHSYVRFRIHMLESKRHGSVDIYLALIYFYTLTAVVSLSRAWKIWHEAKPL